MIVVVDASVAAMWFVPEKHSATASELLSSDHELVAPDLLRIEVCSALLKALRRGDLEADHVTESIDLLADAGIRWVPAVDLLEQAFPIARHHGGSIYDAVYAAAAKNLDAALITNDSKLAAVAKAHKVRCYLLSRGLPR